MRFGPWRLTDFLPANGSCSITCKSSSTFFIETNAPFTAWKTFGATRRGSIGKSQQRRVDVDMKALVPSACLFTWGAAGALPRGTPPYYFGDGDGAGLGPASAGLTPSNSTSKIKVELGAMSGPRARSPYARFGGTKN